MFAFSTAIYGNGNQSEDSSPLMHKLKFVPLDMASVLNIPIPIWVHVLRVLFSFPTVNFRRPIFVYADNSQDWQICTFSIFDHKYFLYGGAFNFVPPGLCILNDLRWPEGLIFFAQIFFPVCLKITRTTALNGSGHAFYVCHDVVPSMCSIIAYTCVDCELISVEHQQSW